MKFPDAKFERSFLDAQKIVVGIDEAGRGPLAGPVVAAAAVIDERFFALEKDEKKLIRDSKTLSEKQREAAFEFIVSEDCFRFGVGLATVQEIDAFNILNATLLAMRRAIDGLDEVLSGVGRDRVLLLVDGNKKVPKIKFEQKVFPKGDQKMFSIAAASICAKVTRDRIMLAYEEKYPQYGFLRHKGYGTSSHIDAIMKFGPCEIHRRSFSPMKEIIENATALKED